MTLDTVAGDTPAAWAMSETFGLFVVLIVAMTLLFSYATLQKKRYIQSSEIFATLKQLFYRRVAVYIAEMGVVDMDWLLFLR